MYVCMYVNNVYPFVKTDKWVTNKVRNGARREGSCPCLWRFRVHVCTRITGSQLSAFSPPMRNAQNTKNSNQL